MKTKIITCFFILIILFLSSMGALQTNSSNYSMDAVISGGGDNVSSDNYNIGAVLGIVTGNSSSISYQQSLGFFSCTPDTCISLGYNCGNWDDGCGGTLDCGTCASGYTCSAGSCVAEEVAPGGGGAAAITPNFEVDKDLIKVLIKTGESKREVIRVINIGGTILNISLDLGDLEEFMVVSEESFSLGLGETKIINIDIFAKEEEIPDAYTGRIIVKGNGITKIINVIIEVKERKPLFDVLTNVRNKRVSPEHNVITDIKMINMGDLEHIDVLFYYAIKDFEGNVLTFKEESLFIEKELEIVRKLKVPENLSPGNYIFYSRVSYEEISATSTDVFTVTEKVKVSNLILFIIVILLIIILIYLLKEKKIKA